MSVAKQLPYVRSRARTEPSCPIAGPSFAHPRTLPQQASSPRPAIASISVASRSILRTAAQFVESAGDIISAIASWMLMQILAGCVAYAIAMYGKPEAALRGDSGEPGPSAAPAPPRNPSRPTVHVILVDTKGDIGADEVLSRPDPAQSCAGAKSAARSKQTPGAGSGWRAPILTPAVLLRSKLRERSTWRRMIAELQNLDDRSLMDIGVSREDIGHIASYGARPE